MARPKKPEGRFTTLSVHLSSKAVDQLRQTAGREYLAGRPGPSGTASVSAVIRRAVDQYLDATSKAS